jgi:hypothetical protein
VIGVNDAALHARVDAAISMDRLWTEHRWPDLTAKVLPTWIRRSALKNIGGRPFWLRPFECDHTSAEMTDAVGPLNGTNSGLCAVNLAFQLRPRLIRLYGMDLANGDRRGSVISIRLRLRRRGRRSPASSRSGGATSSKRSGSARPRGSRSGP